jgi:hypothetical protein
MKIIRLVLISLMFLLLGIVGCRPVQNTMIFENRSALNVSELTVSVRDRKLLTTKLKSKAESRLIYPEADGSFEVKVTFDSGQVMTLTAGYVTAGMAHVHRLVLTSLTIELNLVSVS